MTDALPNNSAACSAGSAWTPGRKRPLLLAAALIAETLWLTALAVLAWQSIAF